LAALTLPTQILHSSTLLWWPPMSNIIYTQWHVQKLQSSLLESRCQVVQFLTTRCHIIAIFWVTTELCDISATSQQVFTVVQVTCTPWFSNGIWSNTALVFSFVLNFGKLYHKCMKCPTSIHWQCHGNTRSSHQRLHT
jgi:hypothetical protein